MNSATVVARIRARRVIPIIRAADAATARDRSIAVVEGGLDLLEISLVTPGALEVISELRERFPDAAVGAGTVLDAQSAYAAAAAGASFVVSPILSRETIAMARRHGLATVPGCLTPTEMVEAISAGADLVKIFPASAWTPADLRGVLEALPQLPTVPTGGVSATAAPEWIRAGAVAVGMGGWLTANEPEIIHERVGELQEALSAVS